MKVTKNIFLARSYLQQYCNKPSVDKPLAQYIRMMDKLNLSERNKVFNDIQVKKLLRRVNK